MSALDVVTMGRSLRAVDGLKSAMERVGYRSIKAFEDHEDSTRWAKAHSRLFRYWQTIQRICEVGAQ